MESSTDWHHRYRANPYAFLGLAFAGGVLLAVGTRNASAPLMKLIDSAAVGDQHRRQVMEAWNDIKGALIAVGTARVADYLESLVPGFNEHFDHRREPT